MEALRNSLKIGVGLAALVGVSLAILPERPTLLGGAAQAEGEPVTANVPASSRGADAAPTETEPVRLAQAGETPAPAAGTPTAGQSHLERLRAAARAGQAPAPSPSATPPAAPAPAAPPSAPASPPPPAAPASAERPATAAGGGAGLDTLTQPAARPDFRLFRSAKSLDSATIEAGGQEVRLAGIVPVPAEAVCADGDRCGASARAALDEWLAGQQVLCAITPGETSAPCVRGEKDIGEWAVENGWARAEPGSVYEPLEAQARDEGVGIWASGGL